MRTHKLLLSLMLMALPMQAMAQAAPVLSIEDVLLQQALNGEGPINARMAKKIAELQGQRALEKSADARASLVKSSAPAVTQASSSSTPVVTEDTEWHTSAGTETWETSGNTITLSAAQLRMLERIERNCMYANIYSAAPQQYHSGAPLAPTGAGPVMLVLSLALGVLVTLWQAHRMGMNMKFWQK